MKELKKVHISGTEIKSVTIVVEWETDFTIFGAHFRVYGESLWINGFDHDDDHIRKIEGSEDNTPFELVITGNDIKAARDYAEYLAEPTE